MFYLNLEKNEENESEMLKIVCESLSVFLLIIFNF